MLETFFYFLLSFFVIRLLFNLLGGVDTSTSLSQADENNDLPLKRIRTVKIKMMQMNGWWYGFYEDAKGRETFVAQGNTYDEALKNCRSSLQKKSVYEKLSIKFERS